MLTRLLRLRPRCPARTPGAMNRQCDRRLHLLGQHRADDGHAWEPLRWGGF